MVNKNDSFFLVIEGLDGSGKTEIARRLVQVLQQTQGNKVKLTFEPHDPSCAGLFIRQALTHKLTVHPKTLALAFAANRADHCDREIDPFLSKAGGRIIVCDRFYLSSLVYQTTATLSMQEVMALNNSVRQPNLIIFLNASTNTCYERMRRRPEDKELFEKNLASTRQKYIEAIGFLRKRGDKVAEVNADKTISEVLDSIINILSGEFGPDWLTIQRPLSTESIPEVFTLNGTLGFKITDIVQRVLARWKPGTALDIRWLQESLLELRKVVEKEFAHLPFNDLGSLFIDYLAELGFQIEDRLSWTDLAAFELVYHIPRGIKQRGVALLLGEAQRYEIITRKMVTLGQLSDFMLILDPRPSQIIDFYERGTLSYSNGSISLSPSIRIIDRSEIARFVLTRCIAYFRNDYYHSLGGIHGSLMAIGDYIKEWDLEEYWETSIKQLSSLP